MKQLFFFSLFLFSISLYSQCNSVLWEISGKDCKQPSYLFGTFHLRDSRIFNFPDSVNILRNKCSVLAFEIVIDKSDAKELLAQIMETDPNHYLDKILSKSDYKKVKKAAKKHLDIASNMLLDKMKPIILATQLFESMSKNDVKYPMDLQFQMEGRELGKIIVGLESIESQMQLINKMKSEEQIKELMMSVDSLETSPTVINQMVNLYLNQNLDSLNSFLNSKSTIDSSFQEDLIDNRNIVMTKQLTQFYLKEGSCFVAVGAGHLVGEKGIIELLRKQGYTVRAVRSSFSKN